MKRYISVDNLPYKTIHIEIDLEKDIAKCFTDNGEVINRSINTNQNITINETYIHVSFPESQELMEEEWFDSEAILDPTEGSAYFVPTNLYIEHISNKTEKDQCTQ